MGPELELQPSHVVRQIHQSNLHRCPDLALGSHQDVALTCALIAEDMFDAGSHLRVPMVGRPLLLVQAAPAAALAVNAALVAAFPQLLLARLGSVGGVRRDGAAAVLVVQDLIEHLAVVGDRVAPDQLVLLVDIDVILIAVVALAVLLGPARVLVFLPLHVRLVVPGVRRLAFLDLLVLVARVAVLRHVDQASNNDLTALWHLPRRPQLLIEALERQPIADLEFGLVVREVVQRLQHQHLEHQRNIVRLASGVALALLLMDDLQKWAKGVPVHDTVQTRQWFTELLQPIFLVEKAWLNPIRPLHFQSLLFCPKRGIIRDAL